MSVVAKVRQELVVDDVSRAKLEVRAGLLMQALMDIEITCRGLADSTVYADLDSGRLEIEVVAVGKTLHDATVTAGWCIHAAIHASAPVPSEPVLV